MLKRSKRLMNPEIKCAPSIKINFNNHRKLLKSNEIIHRKPQFNLIQGFVNWSFKSSINVKSLWNTPKKIEKSIRFVSLELIFANLSMINFLPFSRVERMFQKVPFEVSLGAFSKLFLRDFKKLFSKFFFGFFLKSFGDIFRAFSELFLED